MLLVTLKIQEVKLDAYLYDSMTTRIATTESVRSTIEDADFAEEQMELIKAQIMQQTATAALSQANTAPQIVLQLFQS